MQRAVIIAVAGLAVTACAEAEAKGRPIATELEETVQSEHVADGVTLEGDASGRLPVRVAWVVGAPGLEAAATDGAVVFVVGDVVQAIRASDGQVLWVLDPWRSGDPWLERPRAGSERRRRDRTGRRRARCFGSSAPWEYDIELDRSTGHVLRSGPPGRRRPSREPIRPASARSVLHLSHRSIDHRHDRRPAHRPASWLFGSSKTRRGVPPEQPPLEVGGLIVIGVVSGHVVALRPAP